MRCTWWLCALLALAACGDNLEPPCAVHRCYDARSYALSARFDWGRRRLVGREDISLALGSAGSEIELDADLDVQRVHAGDVDLTYRVDAGVLRVDLAPLRGDPVELTVEYEAPVNQALVAAGPRDDDPVSARVVYTSSEPTFGSQWLVGKHDPSDRALWSVELTVAADEDVIANGERVADRMEGDMRVVGYRMDQPLPTYLMAFAAGQLVHDDRPGKVPLSVWHRRGLVIDPAVNLDMVADAMATFEELLGPYPWGHYAVVLLPDFPGGMENASITFNSETSGLGNGNFELNAHELGHQWFGDWVTMRGYDDAWVKEGMATLLAAEATRRRRDDEATGRRFGNDFVFRRDDAIVNPTLAGLAKYTSGPYQRAAWLLTQIRARRGDDAFWRSLRGVLDDHALDSIDGPTFLRSFGLDDATADRAIAALRITDVPTIRASATPAGDATEVTLQLSDPGDLLVPIDVTVVDAAGAATTTTLGAQPVTLRVPAGGYLAPDEAGVHPPWSFPLITDDYDAAIAPLAIPTAEGARRAFASRSPSHQERALDGVRAAVASPAALAPLVRDLDSDVARQDAVIDACRHEGGDDDAWAAALAPLLTAPPVQRFDGRLVRCSPALVARVILPELTRRTAALAVGDLGRVEYLISFDLGADTLPVLSHLATTAPTLALRDLALSRLSLQAAGQHGVVADDERDAWKAFFRGRLDGARSLTRFRNVWRAIQGLRDLDALPAVAAAMRIAVPGSRQQQVVCEAYALTQNDPAAWQSFVAALTGWSGLVDAAATALRDPSACER